MNDPADIIDRVILVYSRKRVPTYEIMCAAVLALREAGYDGEFGHYLKLYEAKYPPDPSRYRKQASETS